MSRLVAFGCSNTYGQGLRDCIVNKHDPGPNPSMYAWPQLLADKLGLDCVNMSQPGSSPKQVWYAIVNFEFNNDDDVVVIQWPEMSRSCIIKKDNIVSFGAWKGDKESKVYYRRFQDNYDSNIALNMYMSHVHMLLPNSIYQCRGQPRSLDILNWNKANYIDISILDIINCHPRALDNNHPGEEAHQAFARTLYKIMEKQ